MNAPAAARTDRPAARSGWVHFGVAAGLLFVAAVSWNAVLIWIGAHFAKLPVPPPAPARNTDNHRLVGFPDRLGPYVLCGDGELPDKNGQIQKDGRPDGLIILPEDGVASLGVKAHEWDWYYVGIYRRQGAPSDRLGGPKGMRLDVTYYTGLLDPVPHVPEDCLYVAGAAILPDLSGPLPVTLPAPAPWNQIEIERTAYYVPKPEPGTQAAQYYFFSMNGLPTSSRLRVRKELMALTTKYCYFAKVQVSPWPPEPDLNASDRMCRDFLQYAVPEVLRFLPSADDVKKLETGHGAKNK